MRFVLASASPRRKEILTKLGYDFTVHTSNVPENDIEGEIAEVVKTLAQRKAESVASQEENALIIAADTLVAIHGHRLGKPKDTDDAYRMLRALSNETHQVYTGLCLINTADNRKIVQAEKTNVTFEPLSDDEIFNYVNTGEPMDKAGSYAIQGGAARFVKCYEGSYDNIVGFPSELFIRLLPQIL